MLKNRWQDELNQFLNSQSTNIISIYWLNKKLLHKFRRPTPNGPLFTAVDKSEQFENKFQKQFSLNSVPAIPEIEASLHAIKI